MFPLFQNYSLRINASPRLLSDGTGCLPMGIIGLGINGVALFNPYTATGYNAVEGENSEEFDDCGGHPDTSGRYHYHRISECLHEYLFANSALNEKLFGIALDGHPIYVTQDGTQTGLDECNGKMVDGAYRYYATRNFPYLLGCFRGEVIDESIINLFSGNSMQMPGGDMPPTNDEMPPSDGNTPPPDGQMPPSDGQMPPPDGQMPPPDGQMPPPDGQMPPPDGQMPPPNGQMPPPDGDANDEMPPSGGNMPPPSGGGGSCFHANVESPNGTGDLRAGTINDPFISEVSGAEIIVTTTTTLLMLLVIVVPLII